MLPQHGPGRVGALFGVVRCLAGNALTPSVDPFAMNGDQGDTAVVNSPEAGLEKMDQRHVQFTQGNSFDFHGLRQRWETWGRPPPAVRGAQLRKALGGIRPALIPVPQKKRSVAFVVSLKSQNSKTTTECQQELFPIAGLDTSSSLAGSVIG